MLSYVYYGIMILSYFMILRYNMIIMPLHYMFVVNFSCPVGLPL